MRKRKRWWVGPAGLIALAALIFLLSVFRSSGDVDFGPLNLRAGSSRDVAFKVPYPGPYSVGVRMDQRIAKHRFPCMADMDAYASGRHDCDGAATSRDWPLRLSLKLTADGRDVTPTVAPVGGPGGTYVGDDTYTWEAGVADMRPGTRYHLSVHVMADGTGLAPARPRLVVWDADPRFGDTQALISEAACAVAALLGLSAIVWAAVALWTQRRSPVPA